MFIFHNRKKRGKRRESDEELMFESETVNVQEKNMYVNGIKIN